MIQLAQNITGESGSGGVPETILTGSTIENIKWTNGYLYPMDGSAKKLWTQDKTTVRKYYEGKTKIMTSNQHKDYQETDAVLATPPGLGPW